MIGATKKIKRAPRISDTLDVIPIQRIVSFIKKSFIYEISNWIGLIHIHLVKECSALYVFCSFIAANIANESVFERY